jgi:3-methyladenine DNA glycosylase/8-oxoguanine DNA glycosylase
MNRISLAAAVEDVAARDPALARIVDAVGPIRYPRRGPDGHFGELARSIIYQQLSAPSARAVIERVTVAAGGRLTAETLRDMPGETLLACGLSHNKAASLRDLAARVGSGTLDLDAAAGLSDEELIAALVTVRGIGRWTAEIYLLRELRRLDIWPVGDLGVRQGHQLIWPHLGVLTPVQLLPLGDRFRPYRSVVARYCWEAVLLARRGVTL